MSYNEPSSLRLAASTLCDDLDAMALFAKRDLQQLANGLFVVDHQDVRHGAARIFRSCFSCLHSASFNARKLNYELRAFVSFR